MCQARRGPSALRYESCASGRRQRTQLQASSCASRGTPRAQLQASTVGIKQRLFINDPVGGSGNWDLVSVEDINAQSRSGSRGIHYLFIHGLKLNIYCNPSSGTDIESEHIFLSFPTFSFSPPPPSPQRQSPVVPGKNIVSSARNPQ
jgi:hypothetical protein